MTKINREEYEVLNRLIAPLRKFKQYIARDEDGMLNAYRIKPRKYSNGCWVDGYLKVGVQKDLFQFIQWEDENPYNIAELIEEYESEETEVKSKQELIEKWENYKNGARTVADMRAIEYADKFINDLNQLDEPELPVIPQKVADWYENHKDNLEKQLGGIAYNLDKYGDMPEVNAMDKWINETECPLQTLASLKFGYEVAEESKYRLKLNGDYLSRAQIDYEADKGNPMEVTIHVDVNGFPYNFSEDEKSYVEKYLNVEVEELEE